MKNKKEIVDLAMQLHTKDVDLEQVDVVRFLKVHIKHNPMTMFLTLVGIVDKMLPKFCNI